MQTIPFTKVVDSTVSRGTLGSTRLFKSRVFADPVLQGQPLQTLTISDYIMRKAFPETRVFTLCLVQHPTTPDFELYQVDLPKGGDGKIQ